MNKAKLAQTLSFLLMLAILIPVAWHFFPFSAEKDTSLFLVSGPSMEPSLEDGQRIVIQKADDSVPRGAIIVTELPEAGYRFTTSQEIQFIVKRVIAIPGDVIDIAPDNTVRINDAVLDEPYLTDEARNSTHAQGRITHYELAEGEYFVLGDNREVSCDSRHFGPVEFHLISGVMMKKAAGFATVVKELAVYFVALFALYWVLDKLLTYMLCKLFRV